MGSIIISCSLRNEEKDFLDEYNLSPTQLLKEKIWEMKGIFLKLSGDKVARMVQTIAKLSEENENLRKNVGKEENNTQ